MSAVRFCRDIEAVDWARLGFRHLKTAMARFADPARARARGFID